MKKCPFFTISVSGSNSNPHQGLVNMLMCGYGITQFAAYPVEAKVSVHYASPKIAQGCQINC